MRSLEHRYGSAEWLEKLFRESDHDPWGHHWRAVERYRYDVILRLIRRAVSTDTQCTALDVGCSTGHFTAMLSSVVPSVKGVDASLTAVERARRQFPGLSFDTVALPTVPFEQASYSLVTCLEMLYYLDDDGKHRVLQAIDGLLRPCGLVVFSSKIGQRPYFTPHDLTCLVSQVFDIQAVHFYGSSPFARMEKALFDLDRRLAKIDTLLLRSGESTETHVWLRQMKPWAVKAIRAVQRLPSAAHAAQTALRLSSALIRRNLSFRAPVILADWAATITGMPRTHVIVMARKR